MVLNCKSEACAPAEPPAGKHLICGAGGSRAILGSAGVILACGIAGLTKWRTIGGVSGGSIPTLLLAAGYDPKELVRLAVEVDFAALVPWHTKQLWRVLDFAEKTGLAEIPPHQGVFNSEPLGSWVERHVSSWPAGYWTMAMSGRSQVLFTESGVYRCSPSSNRRVLSKTPAPLGIAVRATCAVPGIIDAVEYKGKYLLDGALSWDGHCPSRLLSRVFNASAGDIIACDVGEELTHIGRLVRRFWRLTIDSRCRKMDDLSLPHDPAVIVIEPRISRVRSLQFNLTAQDKWEAVMAGFLATVIRLYLAGLLDGERLRQAMIIAQGVPHLKEYVATSSLDRPGAIAKR